MTKILIVNLMGTYSYGGRAVIKGAINSLKENIPDAQISLMSSHYEKERNLYRKWNYKDVELIDHIWYKERESLPETLFFSGLYAIRAFLTFGISKYLNGIFKVKNDFQEYDVIIDLTTDGPNDHYGLFMTVYPLLNTQLASMSGKPVMISAASIGTFKKPITGFLARHVLNSVNIITAREEITKEYLKSFGVVKPLIYLTADHAFLMRPAPKERIDEIFEAEDISNSDRPIIGVTPSILLHKYAFPNISARENKYYEYINIMVETIKYAQNKLNGQILIIPHARAASSLAVASANAPHEDDYGLSEKIYERVKSSNIRLIAGDYDADELKGVIGRCDLFIGCRMHATIASTSMCVPTVALVYGHKSNGIIGKMLGQEGSIINVEKYNPNELSLAIKSKIDYIYSNGADIRKDLGIKIRSIEEMALLNGLYAKELVKISKKRSK